MTEKLTAHGHAPKFAVLGSYMNVTRDLEKRVQKSAQELTEKYGKSDVNAFFNAALQLGAINTRLRDKAVENAESFIANGAVRQLDFEPKFMEAANALNHALANTKDVGTVEVYVGMFNESVLQINRYQLWNLGKYEKTAENLLVLYAFTDKLRELGRDPIDYTPLIEMAKKLGAEFAYSVFEGETPDSAEWLKKAARDYKEFATVLAGEIGHYLNVLANVLAEKAVGIVPYGDKFSTDGDSIFVPPIFGAFPTKKENKEVYTNSIYHEAKHISALSFVVNALELDISESGWKFEVLGKEEDGLRVFIPGKKEQFKAWTTTDLLQIFENPELAHSILNIIEDRRVDWQVGRDNPGLADDYAAGVLKHLKFRPVAKDANNPAHVLEAFTQLVIAGKTREPMTPELEKALAPLLEITRNLPLDAHDATGSFHATIGVYNELTRKFPLLKTPRSIPMPAQWNENEDHAGMGDPVIVQVESGGFPMLGSGSGMSMEAEGEGEGEQSSDKVKNGKQKNGRSRSGESDEGKEGEDKESEKGKDGEKKGKGDDGEKEESKGKDGKGGDKSESKGDKKIDGKENKDGGEGKTSEKRDKEKEARQRHAEDEKKRNEQIEKLREKRRKQYGNPWRRGRTNPNKRHNLDGKSRNFMPDWNAPGGNAEKTVGEFDYPQWDYKLQLYLPKWTCVKEERVEVLPSFKDKAEGVRNVVNAVKTAFLRIKPAKLKEVTGLPEGEEIDIDRLVEWTVDAELGDEREEDFWMKRKRIKRSVACAVLLDSSGSTCWHVNGRQVIEIEKDAIEVFAAAIDAVGDPYALYAYNSHGRENTRFYIAKEFGEQIKGRPRFNAYNANRDGAAIRHATKKILERQEKRKILLIISDGKPNDDGTEYQDRYALEDTRKAVEESVAKGVIVFCVSVRPKGEDGDLVKIYGEGRVCAIDDVRRLPAVLPLLYRKLGGLR